MKPSICLLALTISLGACSHQHAVDETTTDTGTVSDEDATRLSDGLIAPSQPVLSIEAVAETLILSWQSSDPTQVANVYEYDTHTREESLLAGNLTARTDMFRLPAMTPTRPWNTQQFRIELCDRQDCVSSDRVAIETLAGGTSRTLRPAVFLSGERFAESVTTNYDASLIASTLPVQGAVQIHFHHQKQWVATPPIRLNSGETSTLLDISSSHTGDTLAVLARHNKLNQSGSISILERLGETWIAISELPVPDSATLDPNTRLTLSAEADQLYLSTPERLHIYHRNALDWSLQPSISLPLEPDRRLAATHAGADQKQIHALLALSGSLWLVSYHAEYNTGATTWQETSRQIVQGIDPDGDVFVQGNANGSVLVVAGWDTSIREEKSPVLYRFNVDGNAGNNVDRTLNINASSRLAPTQHHDAVLRFSANENLETLALGWYSLSGEDAQLSTLIFQEQAQHYRAALELPLALPTLAKQDFARDVALSKDGQTLLVSTLPGRATPPDNKAGELMIFR